MLRTASPVPEPAADSSLKKQLSNRGMSHSAPGFSKRTNRLDQDPGNRITRSPSTPTRHSPPSLRRHRIHTWLEAISLIDRTNTPRGADRPRVRGDSSSQSAPMRRDRVHLGEAATRSRQPGGVGSIEKRRRMRPQRPPTTIEAFIPYYEPTVTYNEPTITATTDPGAQPSSRLTRIYLPSFATPKIWIGGDRRPEI